MVWAYAIGLSTNPGVTSRITEWQPTNMRDAPDSCSSAPCAAVVVLIARRGRSSPWPTLAVARDFLFIGAYAARGQAWWPLVAVFAIAGVLVEGPSEASTESTRLDPPDTRLIRRLNLVVVGVLHAGGVAVLPVWRPVEPVTGRRWASFGCPAGITAALLEWLARGPDLQSAALGLVVRVRPPGHTRRDRFADRALPDLGLGRLRAGRGRRGWLGGDPRGVGGRLVVIEGVDAAFMAPGVGRVATGRAGDTAPSGLAGS